MKKIDGTPKTIRELFIGVKYTIHYYQLEYQWQTKHIQKLIKDLKEEIFDFNPKFAININYGFQRRF